MTSIARPTVVSLFSGAGGKDVGFEKAGFDVIWANDIDSSACQTYRHNFNRSTVFEGPIEDIDTNTIPDADVIIGGFPCQGFSVARSIRKEDDRRNALYLEMLRVVQAKKPKVFVAENVRGILSLGGGRAIERIKSDFEDAGYQVDVFLVDATEFGLPQKRERVFIVGNRENRPNPNPSSPLPLNSSFSGDKAKTVRETIGDIVSLGGIPNHEIDEKLLRKSDKEIIKHIGPGQKLCNNRHAWTSVRTWNIPSVFGATSDREKALLEAVARNRRLSKYATYINGKKSNDANPLSAQQVSEILQMQHGEVEKMMKSLELRGFLAERGNGFYDISKANYEKYRRVHWDSPSYTIQPSFYSPRYYLHPSEPRQLTVRECARLQTFPDSFVFKGSFESQYLQVGNAVPPLLAYHVALTIRHAFFDVQEDFTSEGEIVEPRAHFIAQEDLGHGCQRKQAANP